MMLVILPGFLGTLGPSVSVAVELADDDGTTYLLDDDGVTYLTDD